jgi:hypothetical protein
MRLQTHSQTTSAGLLLLCVGLWGIIGGCSCSSTGGGTTDSGLSKEAIAERDRAAKAEAEADAELARRYAAQHAPPPPPAAPKPPTPPQPVVRADDAGAADPQRKPNQSRRPKNVTEWKRDDYYSAKRDGDRQLIAAVTHLGQRFAGNDNAAELLANLLQSPTDDPFAGNSDAVGATAPVNGANQQLIDATVAALAANGTPRARQLLESLVAGTVNTPNNQGAATAALKALLGRYGPENESLLFRIITAPDRAPGESPAAIDQEKLRGVALSLLNSTTSKALRVRLANYMVASETSQAAYDQIWACLKEPRPENMAAQAILYQSERTDPATKDLLEERLIVQSGAALERLLRIGPAKEKKSAATAAATDDVQFVAESLWNAGFVAAVERRLASVDDLDKGKRLMLLASTLPCPAIRDAMVRWLKMHWEEDPKAAGTVGATAEPGLLVVLKRLPRKDTAPWRNPTVSAKTPKAAALIKARQEDDKIAGRWTQFSENVLRTMCGRFRAAAAGNVEVDDVSMKPHPGALVVAAYRFDLPESLSGNAAGLPAASLRVRYVRIDQRGRPTRILAYYRRLLQNCQERTTKEDIWLESLDQTRDGVSRSVDVLITKPKENVPGMADPEQRVIVELLTVECAENAAKVADKQ